MDMYKTRKVQWHLFESYQALLKVHLQTIIILISPIFSIMSHLTTLQPKFYQQIGCEVSFPFGLESSQSVAFTYLRVYQLDLIDYYTSNKNVFCSSFGSSVTNLARRKALEPSSGRDKTFV